MPNHDVRMLLSLTCLAEGPVRARQSEVSRERSRQTAPCSGCGTGSGCRRHSASRRLDVRGGRREGRLLRVRLVPRDRQAQHEDRRRRLPLDPRGTRLPRLPRRPGHRPAPDRREAVLRRLRRVQDLPRAGVGRLPGARPRCARHLRRHAALLELPRQPRRAAVLRAALAHAPVQPAGDVRLLPREPRHHLEVRHPHQHPGADLQLVGARARHQGRRLRRRHLLRLPLHRRLGAQDPRSRRPHIEHQPLQHPGHLRQVPQGDRGRLQRGDPREARRPGRDRRAGVHHLPRRARDHLAVGPALAGVAVARRRGDLLTVSRVHPPQREVRPAGRTPGHVHRLLPRAQEQGRRHPRRQLRVVPRRSPHPAELRPDLDRALDQPADHLRRVPPGHLGAPRGGADPRRHRRRPAHRRRRRHREGLHRRHRADHRRDGGALAARPDAPHPQPAGPPAAGRPHGRQRGVAAHVPHDQLHRAGDLRLRPALQRELDRRLLLRLGGRVRPARHRPPLRGGRLRRHRRSGTSSTCSPDAGARSCAT